MNSFATSISRTALQTPVMEWIKTIKQNGGSSPSSKNVVAVNGFYKSLKGTSFFNKIKIFNPMVSDNLVACCVPLITPTAKIWTNYNFLSTDLNVNGLQGDALGKYLDTTTDSLDVFSDKDSWGLTLYCSEGVNEPARDFGWTGMTYVMVLYTGWEDGNTYGQGLNNAEFALYANAGNPWGYRCFNRTSYTTKEHYWGTEAGGHTLALGETVSNELNELESGNITIYRVDIGGGYFTGKRFSCVAAHDGLTADESAKFFELIQTMRKQMGGGWV